MAHRSYPFILLALLLAWSMAVKAQQPFTLVIDPGHGGRDPGALGATSQEKKINLAVALKLGAMIEKHHPDVKVLYTRKDDTYPSLFDRAELANKNHANLFISIHANATSSKSIVGTETFVFGLSKSKSNLDVAMRENSVILLEDDYSTRYEGFDPTSVESYIMFEFMQNKYMERSVEFAAAVQNQFVKHCKRQSRGVKESELIVLHRSACPGVLVELGFISNPDEERYMTSEKGQTALAEAISNAFDDYKRDYDKRSNVGEARSTPSADQVKGKPVFKVQFATTRERLKDNDRRLKGLRNVECIEEDGMYKYMAGSTSDYDKIQKTRKEVQNKFPDAFVVAFLNGEKIPVAEALKLIEE